ncbi:MAG: hypothetical protein EPN34_02405 [Burkholderiaceae bacterium]|nr:MAG: hypothetical protein EPN34_02405 [Burkholderiaceae bacterium]
MAEFVGTEKEFRRYIVPFARNLVQQLTAKSKTVIGRCEDCGAETTLEAAHIHESERNDIIHQILGNPTDGSSFRIDLKHFETQFRAAHEPLSKVVKFLCRACHDKYDGRGQAAPQKRAKPRAVATSQPKVLPITLDPESEDAFRDRFLQTGRAEIETYFNDGRMTQRIWKRRILDNSSDVRGNLRSRPEFRKDAWQDAGIERVHVRVLG